MKDRFETERPNVQNLLGRAGSEKRSHERNGQVARPNVLVVSQGSQVQRAVHTAVADCGISAISATTVEEARVIANLYSISLIFCVGHLPGALVEDFIRQVTLPPQRVPVVMVLRVSEWERCPHFLDVGAIDCVVYPCSAVEIRRVTDNVLGLVRLQKPAVKPAEVSVQARETRRKAASGTAA